MNMRFQLTAALLGGLLASVAHGVSTVGVPVVNPANQHTYYLLTAATWTDSQAFAQTLGGNLATINDAAENTFVFNTFGTERDLWIGYNDQTTEGTFIWISGETPTFTNWRLGQPDNFSTPPVTDEDYVHIYGTQTAFGGQWNDAANDPSVYAGFFFANEVSPIQGVVEVNTPEPSSLLYGVIALGGMSLLRHGPRCLRRGKI